MFSFLKIIEIVTISLLSLSSTVLGVCVYERERENCIISFTCLYLKVVVYLVCLA